MVKIGLEDVSFGCSPVADGVELCKLNNLPIIIQLLQLLLVACSQGNLSELAILASSSDRGYITSHVLKPNK